MENLKIVIKNDLDSIIKLAACSNRLVYAFQTCWWKVGDPIYQKSGLPCGPRGEMLMETDNPMRFINDAMNNPRHYGEYGLKAFVSGYHGNLITIDKELPSSFDSWDKYNLLLKLQEG